MPVVSADVYRVLFTVSRYLFPFLAVLMVLFALLWMISESRERREKIRKLPGSGMIGELIVLSGSRELPVNTWFPVPREGVLGAVRSCDLVVPCPGVHPRHLDFSWQDGKGLLLFPRTGCEVIIDGCAASSRAGVSAVPLIHGSVLQVGSAMLRLHLFAALDHVPQNQDAGDASSVLTPFVDAAQSPANNAMPTGSAYSPPSSGQNFPDAVHHLSFSPPLSSLSPDDTTEVRPHSSNQWKEDLGE